MKFNIGDRVVHRHNGNVVFGVVKGVCNLRRPVCYYILPDMIHTAYGSPSHMRRSCYLFSEMYITNERVGDQENSQLSPVIRKIKELDQKWEARMKMKAALLSTPSVTNVEVGTTRQSIPMDTVTVSGAVSIPPPQLSREFQDLMRYYREEFMHDFHPSRRTHALPSLERFYRGLNSTD